MKLKPPALPDYLRRPGTALGSRPFPAAAFAAAATSPFSAAGVIAVAPVVALFRESGLEQELRAGRAEALEFLGATAEGARGQGGGRGVLHAVVMTNAECVRVSVCVCRAVRLRGDDMDAIIENGGCEISRERKAAP